MATIPISQIMLPYVKKSSAGSILLVIAALSETLEQLTDIGNRTYLYASSYLVCLETEITVELINKLAELDPLPIKFIFRDSAFKDDIALKDETFRRLKALIEKNAGTDKPTYTVEFI